MSLSDSFGDFITRLRNGYMAGKSYAYVLHSKMNSNALAVLKKEGFIDDFITMKINPADKFPVIKVFLKYNGNDAAIVEIKRISKPGRRVYSSIKDIKPIYNGFGMYLLSTVKGIITNHAAKELNVGGEVLCSVF
ncbi:Small ribosomal subunit protein uS8 [Candidatus Xenohaliotis californiensis]|uniref:Small ribosomal subunit protein uS8 n=1 Tax=Candidatus Xenohaliotis californiensis TaxID=84677 RepID=A0ABP0EWL5_9RICK|nr:Small ribosomal subunit protein uS8 [Candidatus Xenohaliotis californiensis]